jgi:hypothetical protein
MHLPATIKAISFVTNQDRDMENCHSLMHNNRIRAAKWVMDGDLCKVRQSEEIIADKKTAAQDGWSGTFYSNFCGLEACPHQGDQADHHGTMYTRSPSFLPLRSWQWRRMAN